MNDNRILLVDGMALLFRAFYATAVSGYYMINSKGVPTNAIYGFLKHLLLAKNNFNPTHIVCCWDMGSKTYRTEIFPEYKANRGEPPAELVPQFDLAKEVVEILEIPNVGIKGYEADDCIGTLLQAYANVGKCTVLTGDKDLLQLLDKNIEVAILAKGYGNYNIYNKESFIEENGITPQQLVDVKALMGDTSDNYPGVKGIGEKTALKLIREYETIEGILENLDKLTIGQRAKIEQDLDMLHLSRKLAKIHCETPVSCSLDAAVATIKKEKLEQICNDLELKDIDKLIS